MSYLFNFLLKKVLFTIYIFPYRIIAKNGQILLSWTRCIGMKKTRYPSGIYWNTHTILQCLEKLKKRIQYQKYPAIYMLYVSPIQRECQIKILHQSGDMYMQRDQVCCWKDLSSAFIWWWSQFFFSFWIFRLKFYFAINLINDVHVAMFYNLGEIQMLGYLD